MEIYTERGGIWLWQKIGTLSVTWPFANIAIDQNNVTLNIDFFALNREIKIPFENISTVERKKYVPFFADGVKIVTKNMDPKWVYFWSLYSSDRIIHELKDRMQNKG